MASAAAAAAVLAVGLVAVPADQVGARALWPVAADREVDVSPSAGAGDTRSQPADLAAAGDDASSAGPISDEFDAAALNTTIWSLVDPVGDASVAVGGGRLSLAVPAGVAHDFWNPVRAPRLVQAAPNTDIAVAARFDSAVTARYQSQGLVAAEGSTRFVRFDTYHDGTSQRLFAATFVNGTPTSRLNTAIAATAPVHLRLERAGDTWNLRWSADGTTWSPGAAFTFPMAMSAVGVFVGNAGPNPAMTALVDSFHVEGSTPPPSGPVSDDFSAPGIDPARWTFVDPSGNSALAPTGTNAALSVRAGTTHDMWTGTKNGAQLLQTTPDTDFEIETKFESRLTLNRQTRGLVVRADADVFLRFDESFDGAHRLFAATVNGTSATSRLNQVIPAGDDLYLRIRRQAGSWTLRYSRTGATWTTAATFTHPMTVTAVGPYVANSGGPAAVASVDYFSNLAAPVLDDDAGAPPATSAPGLIDVWYGTTRHVGARGFAQQWVDVAGTATDPDGLAQLSYTVNGSPPRLLSIGPNTTRLVGAGDFVAEIDQAELAVGANSVVLSAFDRLGHTTSVPVTLHRDDGLPPPLPDAVDWSGVSAIDDVAQVVDGRWAVAGDTVRTQQTGYDRLVAVGATSWPAGYEVTVPITMHATAGGGVGVLVGWTGHTGTVQPRTGHPYGALGWWRPNRLELVDTTAVAVASTPRALVPGTSYTFRLRAEPSGAGTSVYRLRVWETALTEPAAWDLTTTLPSRAGSTLLVAHHTDASFGTVRVAPVT